MKIVCAMSGGVDSSIAAALLEKEYLEGDEFRAMHAQLAAAQNAGAALASALSALPK